MLPDPAPSPDAAAPTARPAQRGYWPTTLRVTGALLLLWFVLSFVMTWFAPAFTFRMFGLPFSHWLASQGTLVAYCAIIWGYAIFMNRLDRAHGVTEQD